MNKQEEVIKWLKKTDIPLTTISKKTGITRQTLSNWVHGTGINKNIQSAKINIIYNKYINTSIKVKGSMKAQYIIDLQKEKIERLEQTIAKHKSTPIQSTVWDNIEHDFVAKLTLTFKNFKLGRTITEITNQERICDVLGYSRQEVLDFWDIGALYSNFDAHPIDKILTKDTLRDINSKVSALPNIFEALKDMLGNHYIPVPVTYICKDKSFVHSIAYNKVDWKNKTVESKIHFLLNE